MKIVVQVSIDNGLRTETVDVDDAALKRMSDLDRKDYIDRVARETALQLIDWLWLPLEGSGLVGEER